MRVLMISRSTLYTSPGGDTIQILNTAKYLRELGLTIDICLSNELINYNNYDLVHFFNIIRPHDILPHVLNSNIPFVVSTILVDYFEYERKSRNGVIGLMAKAFNRSQIEYLKTVVRLFKNGEKINSIYYLKMGHQKSIKHIIQKAALLLPNSHSEYNRLERLYNIHKGYQKIVNAIDTRSFQKNVLPASMFNDCIICVGRIEGLKNQLNVIKALSNTDLKLILIGKPAPNHRKYFEECVKEASKATNVQIIEHVNHSELAPIYKAAKVHVLASWFETTGLSSLEAGVMGCNIVVSKKGDTEEYFGDMAYYCEPDDVVSIKDAVLKAYNAPSNTKLQEYILNNYTWQHTAEQTLNAYMSILSN
jgi:glycosyltransferase involved in cell wall biosynthesis